MSVPMSNRIEQAYAELEQHRTAFHALRSEAQAITTTVTSRNRAVSVTVDSRGEITELKFVGGAYRTMAPAELANLIVDTLRQARTEAMTTMAELYRPHLPAGFPATDLLAGKVDIDRLIKDAIALVAEPFPGTPAGSTDE